MRVRGLRVIREFDPWGSRLCTCPLKFTLNPYTGCGHGCIYCYARPYIRNFNRPRPKESLIVRVLKDLDRLPKGALISMSESSDPYTPPEVVHGLTRRVLKVILERGFRVLIVTKSDLVTRDKDLLSKYPTAVSITITTPKDEVARIIEPGAPSPSRRLMAVKELSDAGIPVTVRVDPIIPGVNDSPDELEELVERVAGAGAVQVTSSTFKARWDSLKNLGKAFPNLRNWLYDIYVDKGERIRGYFYLPSEIRLKYMALMKKLAEKHGLAFATCREGFYWLHTPGIYCDGSAYAYR